MTKPDPLSGPRPFGIVIPTSLTVRRSQTPTRFTDRQVPFLPTALFLLLAALPAWRAHAQSQHMNMCCRVTLSEPISWATSGAWSTDQGEKSLLVVDALKKLILRIRSNGEVMKLPAPFELGRPSQIRASSDGLLLEDEALSRIAHLDRQLELVGSTQFENRDVDFDSGPVWRSINCDRLNVGDTAESRRNSRSAMLLTQYIKVARAASVKAALARAASTRTTSMSDFQRASSGYENRLDGGHHDTHGTFGATVDSVLPLDSGADESGPRDEGAKVTALYDWSPMGNGILAFADLTSPQGDLQSAFLYLGAAGQQRIFYRGPTIADTPNPHRLQTMRYIATLGNTGYILSLVGRPTISQVRLDEVEVQHLRLLPEGFRDRPRLEAQGDWSEPRQMTNVYKALEESALAAGLYAWDNSLYLLAKRAAATNGDTAWWLIRLDPQDGKELSRVRLPTAAAHLTVVPGDFWALIEKGPVQGIGASHAPYMETSSMVLVPAAWLEYGETGQLPEGTRVTCEMLPS